jgi:DDE superfamily endonuclease
MDSAYGNNSDLRADITALELTYVVGILSNTTVWAPGTGPLPAKTWSGRGRPPKLLRRDTQHRPVSVKELALGLPKRAWRTVEWREGTAERLSSRFARVRVRIARRDFKRSESRPEEWLLIEWPNGEKEPTKYWLSTLPKAIALHRLAYFAKLRWRIERDYQELKQEVGLGHFEGRGWRGFHHHATQLRDRPLRLQACVSPLLPSKIVKHAKVIPVDVLGKEFVELVRLRLWRVCDSGPGRGPLRVERVNLGAVGKIQPQDNRPLDTEDRSIRGVRHEHPSVAARQTSEAELFV